MDRWIGKVAVITGASSGIGEAIAKSLTIAGMNVFGLARREDRLTELSKELESAQGSFDFARCDVRKEEDIIRAFEIAEKKYGGVDVLVNNAGVNFSDTLRDGKTENFRAVLEVNVLAVAICTREAMKSMRKRKTEGHIFNINSVFGLTVPVKHAESNIYPASKHALRAMTDCLRDEIILTKDNIRITSIHPGLVKTEMPRLAGIGDEILDFMPHLQSDEIATAVVYALSMAPGTEVTHIGLSALHEKL